MRTWTASGLAAIALVVSAGLFVGCGEADPGSAVPARTYTVNGKVVTLAADNGGELRIAHEAIDDFVAADGAVVGMDAMTMSFVVAEGVGEGLAVGDIVEFDLRVDWGADDLATVTRIEMLPAETELVFDAASPPSDGGPTE